MTQIPASKLPIYFCRILTFVALFFAQQEFLDAETKTQIKAREWMKERNLFMRRPEGFISVPSIAGAQSPAFQQLTTSSLQSYAEDRLMAGHLLRRLGFGPNPQELNAVLSTGIPAYVELQLNPTRIDDSAAIRRLPDPPRDFYADFEWIMRWYTRMVYSRRQLQEKMTLIWHEHFAAADSKVGVGGFMHQYEDTLRKNSLGNFRDLLIAITKDQAMLVFLDNNFNNGNAFDDNGNRIPPNENYAREFLQLFALGTDRLNMDGSVQKGSNGLPIPTYSEKDVKEVSRALTGWYVNYRAGQKSKFDAGLHDSGKKTILGVTVNGRTGPNGASEVNDVVDILMKQPTMAPFISKILIQKLATETPSPGYVERVARVFQQSGGNIRSTVRAILLDTEFYSPAVVRTQYKEPVEQFVGALRALGARTEGVNLIYWTYAAEQLVYYPPSVFSFYPPGNKHQLINTALVTIRDRVADDIVSNAGDTSFDVANFLPKASPTPSEATDFIIDALITAPPDPALRSKVLSYFKGQVNEEKVRGAIWLVLCSPDFQRN
jgi:uncharacterized protein (DUF1800 family)